MNTLTQHIEALLFYKGEPMKISSIATTLEREEREVEESLQELTHLLEGHGISLIREGAYVGLATAKSASELIQKVRKQEVEGPLGKAGLETLAIIIYQGASTRADIEYIRGVNCSSILRTLAMRGLVERIENPHDKRSFLYKVTPEVPALFGVSNLEELPEYKEHKQAIAETLEVRDSAETTPESHEIIS